MLIVCFSLTSRFFIYYFLLFHIFVYYHFSDFPNVYFSTGAKYFVYPCKTEWRSLIFRIPQNLPYLFWDSVSCRYDPLFFLYTRMGEWKRFFCPSHLGILSVEIWCLIGVFADYFIYIFLSRPFFCKACFRWLSSICKCSLSEISVVWRIYYYCSVAFVGWKYDNIRVLTQILRACCFCLVTFDDGLALRRIAVICIWMLSACSDGNL